MKSVFNVLDDNKIESLFDTILKMTFKTSFNTLCLRSILQDILLGSIESYEE